MDIKKDAFSCTRDRFTIRGFEYRNKNSNGTPIIMSHAFLSNQKIMQKYATALALEGYIVFTYDFCGGATLGKSDGKHTDMTIETEKDDLKAVIDYVSKIKDVDINKLILMGASQGGFVSCLVAAEYQGKLNKLILLYPALCIPDDAAKGKMLMMKFDPKHIRETFKSKPLKFSPAYPESAINIKIYEELKKIDIPMLIIHGTEDKIVDIQYAQRAIDAASNKDSRLVIIPKAGHGFNKQEVTEALNNITAFLK